MEYVQMSMDEYIQSKNDIKNNLGGIVKSFVRIGWQLTRIDRSGAYKNDGYSSIAEFAAAEYGMNRTGVSRFIPGASGSGQAAGTSDRSVRNREK